MNNKLIKILLKLIIGIIYIITPLIFLAIGMFLLVDQSYHLIMLKVTLADVDPQSRPVEPFKVIAGLLSFISAIILPIYSIKKGLSMYGWYISLTMNALFLFILFIYITTPLLDFAVLRISFSRGICNYLDKVDQFRKTQETWPKIQSQEEARHNLCQMMSKELDFRYP